MSLFFFPSIAGYPGVMRAKMKAGDDKATKTFPKGQSTKAVSGCPERSIRKGLGKTPVQSKTQCDIVDVIVKDDPISWTFDEITTQEGQWVPKTAATAAIRQISFKSPPKGTKNANPTLEVCSDFEGSKRNAKIDVTVKNFASHVPRHPRLTITRDGNVIEEATATSKKLEVYATSRPIDLGDVGSYLPYIFKHYWNMSFNPVCYQISVDTCGFRHKQATAVGAAVIDVLVYPYDRYELSFQLFEARSSYKTTDPLKLLGLNTPDVLNTEWGAHVLVGKTKRGNDKYAPTGYTKKTTINSSGTSERETSWNSSDRKLTKTTSNKDGNEVTASSGTTKGQKYTNRVKINKKFAIQKRAFQFKRNGAEDENSIKFDELIEKIKSLIKFVKTLSHTIREYVPQAGFKFTAEAAFLEGFCNIAWGWEEAENLDPRVFFAYDVNVELTLVRANINLSFGVDVGIAEAKAEIIISGQVDVAAGPKRSFPDEKLGFKIEGTGTIEGKAQATGRAGIGWLSVSAEIGIKTGIYVNGTLQTSPAGLSLNGGFGFTGIAWWVMTSGAGVGDEAHPDLKEIMAPDQWGEFAYP